MNREYKTEPAGRIRYSITRKLNRRLFFRNLSIFVTLNVLILILSCLGLAYYCETTTTKVYEKLSKDIVPAANEINVPNENAALNEITDSGANAAPGGNAATGENAAPDRIASLNEIPYHEAWADMSVIAVRESSASTQSKWKLGNIANLLSRDTMDAPRGFRADSGGFNESIGSITYLAYPIVEGIEYEISLKVGQFILLFFYAFAALHVFELFNLLSKTIGDRQMVRKTLDPITELARATQSLQNVSEQLNHEKMMLLKGELDGIDGNKLDARIPVDDLQEELKNLAMAINGMLDRINESYAAQARFVSDASHELRTPIAVIQGYANLLDRWGKEDEKTLSESVTAIKDEAGNMKDLVEQLLFLARGDSNTIRLSQERIELSELIEEVAMEARMLDSGHLFSAKDGDGVAIIADRSLIKQALRILVDNSIKYTDTGGDITIAASREGNMARLAVSDDGIGISPDIIPHVFDRFVRADESRTRSTGGAGLGLSIAQWIATRHNGHMEILSREGIGTRISFIMPAAAALEVPKPVAVIDYTELGEDLKSDERKAI